LESDTQRYAQAVGDMKSFTVGPKQSRNTMTFEQYLDMPYILRAAYKMSWYRTRICANCQTIEGHSLPTCKRCGHKTMLLKEYKASFTLRDWVNDEERYKDAREVYVREEWELYLTRADECKRAHKYKGTHVPSCHNNKPCKRCLNKWIEVFYS